MKRMSRTRLGKPAFSFIAVLCLAVLALMLVQESQATGTPQQRGGGAPKIKVGEFPPDFELPILTFGEDANGNPAGIINEREKIRISDFFGKRPLCMIMSSYT